MAQIDSNLTQEQLAQMEREFARKRAAAERRRKRELARLSEQLTFVDELQTSWSYYIVDGTFIRIISCVTNQHMLEVPSSIKGLPVRELDPEALSGLAAPREIRCADTIEAIRAYAFRSCENLERITLPALTNDFSATWFSKCPQLKEIVLPDALETITADVLANPAVEHLVIGTGTRGIEPGAFEKSPLKTIRIDERNEFLITDGTCIYSADGTELYAFAITRPEYHIAPACRRICTKAFVGATELEQISLPDSLEEIETLAFARSGLVSLSLPERVSAIGPKAFMRCQSLHEIDLNDGLRSIGEEAFAGSALTSLRIPATVDAIGRSITERSEVIHAGSSATFSIDGANPRYRFDEYGCLYQQANDGMHLAQFLEPTATSYRVADGTVAIDDKAFAFHGAIESVDLPPGLKRIGIGAFRVCRELKRVDIPDSLESIGKDAFIDTALATFKIPALLTDIGPCALVTDGAHHEGKPPSLRTINVNERNPRFFMHTGMLCRRKDESTSIVAFTNSVSHVVFPEDTEVVEDYAFNNAFGIEELHLNARLQSIGACGLSVWCSIKHVRIDVAKPIEGRSSFILNFPNTSRSVHGFLLALGGLGSLYLPDIMAQYDNCIVCSRDYHAPDSSDNASAYEQVKLILGRLNDSVLLTDTNRRRYHDLLERNIEEICVDIARHDDRKALEELANLGYLNEDNLEDVTIAVARLQDAATTGYLLEMKRLRFGRRAFDFDL
jgi:hypothetical protein